MQFPWRPFNPQAPTYLTAQHVQEYLEDFCKDQALSQLINYNAQVTKITPTNPGKENSKWALQWVMMDNNYKQQCQDFDAVVVCNGHFNRARIPIDPKKWLGETSHSSTYRNPEPFRNKVVVIVGASSSGAEIAREIARCAAETHVCDPACPSNEQVEGFAKRGQRFYQKLGSTNVLAWRPRLKRLRENSKWVEFEEGPPLQADHVLFCTGYEFDLDFIDSSVLENPYGKRVYPVYQQIMHVQYQTLFFPGLLQPSVPFPLFFFQAQWIATMLLDPKQVPKHVIRAKQLAEQNKRIQLGVLHPEKTHVVDQWDYILMLIRQANMQTHIPHDAIQLVEKLRSIHAHVRKSRPKYPGAHDGYRHTQLPPSLL
jgi:hypothetical protein